MSIRHLPCPWCPQGWIPRTASGQFLLHLSSHGSPSSLPALESCLTHLSHIASGLLRWLSGKKILPANAGDTRDAGSIPGLGRFPGGGSGNPLQHLCAENSMDGGTWRATVHGVAKSQTQLSTQTHTHTMEPHHLHPGPHV